METLMVFPYRPPIEDLKFPSKCVEDEAEEAVDEGETQVFDDHDILSERFRKTLYYGQLPTSGDRFSLSMTELCVEKFNDLGLEALEAKLNKLDMEKAAEITRNTCASPTSLILALIYLDRLRNSNPAYLHSVSSTDLFLVSLMVASKFLHDDGEEDEVFNDEWASSASMETKDLNTLEIDFLMAIQWNIYVSQEDFQKMTSGLETAIATRQVNSRGWTTYTDLLVLSRNLQLQKLWTLLAECTFKVTAVCASAYAASLMTMVGTCYLLSKTSLSPANVQTSMQTIYASIGRQSRLEAGPEMTDLTGSASTKPCLSSTSDDDVMASILQAAALTDAEALSEDLSLRLGLNSLPETTTRSSSTSDESQNCTQQVPTTKPIFLTHHSAHLARLAFDKTHCNRNSLFPPSELFQADPKAYRQTKPSMENSISTLIEEMIASATAQQRHDLLATQVKFGLF